MEPLSGAQIDVEERLEQLLAVVGGTFGGHLPNVVRTQLSMRLEAGHDIDRELRKPEFLDAEIRPCAHPASYRNVVSDQLHVAQLGRIDAAFGEIELEHAGPALRLVPSETFQKQLGIHKVGTNMNVPLAVRILGDGYLHVRPRPARCR